MNESKEQRSEIKLIRRIYAEKKIAGLDEHLQKKPNSLILIVKSLYGKGLYTEAEKYVLKLIDQKEIGAEDFHWIWRFADKGFDIDINHLFRKVVNPDPFDICRFNLAKNNLTLSGLQDHITNLSIVNSELPTKNGKVAICITGQIRGFESALDSIKKHFFDKTNADIFFCTWDTIGYKFERLIPDEIKAIIPKDYPIDYDFAKKYLPRIHKSLEDKFSIKSKAYIEGLISKIPNLTETMIVEESSFDSLYPNTDTKILNQYKLFYLMALCADMVEKQEQLQNHKYEKIIKIRPDKIFLEDFNFDSVKAVDDIAFNNLDYFGVGDQTIYGYRDKIFLAMKFWPYFENNRDEFVELTKDLDIKNHASYTKYLWAIHCNFNKISHKSNGALKNLELGQEWFFSRGLLNDLDSFLTNKQKTNILRRNYFDSLKFVAKKLEKEKPSLSLALFEEALQLVPKSTGLRKKIAELKGNT